MGISELQNYPNESSLILTYPNESSRILTNADNAKTECRTFAVSWKSRLLEATRADSRDQHVQTPEVAKTGQN